MHLSIFHLFIFFAAKDRFCGKALLDKLPLLVPDP